MKKDFFSRKKKGMTIVEMITAIGVFAIAVAGLTALFSNAWKANSYTIEMGQSSMAVSQGLNKIVNYVREARQSDNGSYPIKSGSANDLVIYSDYDNDGQTERLHIYKSGQDILMGVTDPTSTMPRTYPSGDQSTIIIAGHIVNNAGEPIFNYYNEDYPADTANNPLSAPVDVSSVRLIGIRLKINIVPNRDPDNVEIQSFVELRNLSD